MNFLQEDILANEMLYYNGEYVKGAALECVEYVMANTAPSHVTGIHILHVFLMKTELISSVMSVLNI